MSVRTAEYVMNDELLKAFLDIVFKIKKDFYGPITDDEAEKQKKEVFERVKLQREGKTPVELAVLIQTEYRKIIPGTPQTPTAESNIPDDYYFPVSKLGGDMKKTINTMMKGGKKFAVNISNEAGKGAALVVIVSAMPNAQIIGEFTSVDAVLHNVICSFYEAGRGYVTMNSIYKAIYKKKPNGAQQKRLKELLMKQNSIRVIIDATKAKGAFGDRVESVDSALLNYVIKKERLPNGKAEERFYFLQEPPLWKNARALGQYSKIPMNVLDALPQSILAEGTAARLNYINLRIARMRKNGSGRILWETYFSEVCPDMDIRAHGAREKKAALDVLDTFKDAGVIKKYTADPDGVTIETKNKKTKK